MTEPTRFRCIHELFEEQVLRIPNATAIEFRGRLWTYAKLNRKADELANQLRRESVISGAFVALLVERSPEMIAAFLAILKCSAVCVPLDTSSPPERTSAMVSDAKVSLLVSSFPVEHLNVGSNVRVVWLETDSPDRSEEQTIYSRDECNVDEAAYVIYTSGSTGTPKGVIATHSTLLNGLYWMWDAYPFEESDVCCFTRSQLNLIDSIWEIFLPILKGVPLSILPDSVLKDPPRLIKALRERRVTRIALVPSLLRLLIESCEDLECELPDLRLWMSSGEALRVDLAENLLRLFPRSRILNLYGLSEVPDVTYFDSGSAPLGGTSVPIGLPVSNTAVYLLNPYKDLVPRGEPGELHVGGPGLAAGYLGRSDLTAERFVPDAFGKTPGRRLYDTGDLARYGSDGYLEFLGRRDLQVNIHGFRVEIGEIEAALSHHPAVKQAVVVLRGDRSDGQALAAYVLVEADDSPTSQELRSYLKEKLPYYMIPGEFITVDMFPLTRSGKVDRLVLSRVHGSRNSRQIVEPRSVLELQLTQIWQDLLKTGPLSIFDEFFDLGGDSLSAISLICQIEQQLGESLPVNVVLEAGTIASLAKRLTEKTGSLSYGSLVVIRRTGSYPPLFIVHGIGGEVLEFHNLARHLGSDQPVYGLQSPLVLQSIAEDQSIEEVAAQYLEAIQESYPEGPYLLAGYSWGGIVAFEIAQQLLSRNQPVSLVAVLDAYPENPFRSKTNLIELESLLENKEHLLLASDYQSVLDPSGQFKEALARLELALSQEGITEEFGEEYRRSYVKAFIARTKALSRYEPRVFAGKLTLFRSEESSCEGGWNHLVTLPAEVFDIPGTHLGILQEPNVQVLANHLQRCISRATDGGIGTQNENLRQQSEPPKSGGAIDGRICDDEEGKDIVFKVVLNHEEQYSIWPADRENPMGWNEVGKIGTKEECLTFIQDVWTDLRPLSRRKSSNDSSKLVRSSYS